MRSRSKQTRKTDNVSDFYIYFNTQYMYLYVNILKSGNVIPDSYHFAQWEEITEDKNLGVGLKINFTWMRVCLGFGFK